MNENVHSGEEDRGDEQGQDQSLNVQQEDVGRIIHADYDSTDREGIRREYRRRMTLDPLVDLLVEGLFSDGDDNSIQNEEQDGSEEGIHLNIDDHAANNNAVEMPAANNNGDDNYSQLELLGQLLGRNVRNGSGNDSTSSDENANENNRAPPQPARNHSYLPTPQPLYPEEWIPAGQHRHRLGMSGSSVDEVFDKDSDTDAKNEENAERDVSDHVNVNKHLHGIDKDVHLPPLLHSLSDETKCDFIEEPELPPTYTESANDLTTLAIMEMEDVVLFPGSIIPLRLRERKWITYLGALIDDARGLYGSHQGTTGGRGEVRIVILPRISAGTRRTQRRPREGGGRTGRWRVDLIRRGVTGTRRLNRNRRRRRSNSNEAESIVNSSRHESRDGRTGHHTTSIDTEQDGETLHHQNRAPEQSSSDEDNEDDLFRPPATRPAHSDPLVDRIGTMATITFTHEETTAPLNDSESPTPRANNVVRRGRVWQDRGDELVVTILGTTRVRLIRSMIDDKSAQDRPIQIPLYAVEEIHDCSASLPPAWLLRPPGDIRFPMTTHTTKSTPVNNNEDVEDMESDCHTEPPTSQNVCTDYSSAIRNLSVRSSIPAIAYRAVWPWGLCRQICSMIQSTKELEGLSNILHSAAGLRLDVEEGHNDDLPDTASGERSSTPIQFQVEDPSAFANWISSNMPLSQNDRLALLEMMSTVQQLRYILQKLEEKRQETTLRCKHCGAVISQMRHVFSVGGSEGTTGAYVNEHGVVHQTVTLRKVDNHSVVCIGRPETKDSWFPGYSWTIAYCSICSDHLGWKFRRASKGDDGDDPDRPRTFWGFSSITTDEHVSPRRVSFQTRQALTALLRRN